MKMEASTPGSEAEHIGNLVVARTLRKLALSVEQAQALEDFGRSITAPEYFGERGYVMTNKEGCREADGCGVDRAP
jgi:hypothetical protein